MSQSQSELPEAQAGQERKMTKDRTLACTMLSSGESTPYGYSLSTLAGAGTFLQ